MKNKIKYAIIGAGCMGQEHILNIEIIDDAEVVAICDTSEQSIKDCLNLLKNEVEDIIKKKFKNNINFT